MKHSVHYGKSFENLFYHACLGSGAVTRMPDGCKVLGKNRLVRVKTSFDWILTFRGRSAFIDTKTSGFNYFRAGEIKDHQLEALCAHETCGAIAGYVVELRPMNGVFFVPAWRLTKAFKDRESIQPDGMKFLGASTHFSPWIIFD